MAHGIRIWRFDKGKKRWKYESHTGAKSYADAKDVVAARKAYYVGLEDHKRIPRFTIVERALQRVQAGLATDHRRFGPKIRSSRRPAFSSTASALPTPSLPNVSSSTTCPPMSPGLKLLDGTPSSTKRIRT